MKWVRLNLFLTSRYFRLVRASISSKHVPRPLLACSLHVLFVGSCSYRCYSGCYFSIPSPTYIITAALAHLTHARLALLMRLGPGCLCCHGCVHFIATATVVVVIGEDVVAVDFHPLYLVDLIPLLCAERYSSIPLNQLLFPNLRPPLSLS